MITLNDDAGESLIYVLLMRSNTLFSRFIKIMTGGKYTHSSIGVQADCGTMYSFARIYSRLPLPAGFVKEHLNSGILKKCSNAPCALLRIRVSPEVKIRLADELEKMFKVRNRYRYNLAGTFQCYFNHPAERKDKFFCSQFVAHTLCTTGAIKLFKPASLYKPMDFFKQPELEVCYEGTLGGLSAFINKKIKNKQTVEISDQTDVISA